MKNKELLEMESFLAKEKLSLKVKTNTKDSLKMVDKVVMEN
jgi:hypothetical protein